jgi:hypothetical protein
MMEGLLMKREVIAPPLRSYQQAIEKPITNLIKPKVCILPEQLHFPGDLLPGVNYCLS